MRWVWMTWLWPGLPRLWRDGQWPALGLAIGFAALFNLALAATAVWPQWLDPAVRTALWLGMLAIWIGSIALAARRHWRMAALGQNDGREDLYPRAILEYLKGNYFAALGLADGLIQRKSDDLEARLLRATILRRTGQGDDAARELHELDKQDAACHWRREIDCERNLLSQPTETETMPESTTKAA